MCGEGAEARKSSMSAVDGLELRPADQSDPLTLGQGRRDAVAAVVGFRGPGGRGRGRAGSSATARRARGRSEGGQDSSEGTRREL